MSRVGFYGKDQSEARKTGPDWPILPCKDLFLGNTTSGSDIALLKRAISLPEAILPSFFLLLFFFLRRKAAQPSRKCTCARFASTEKVSTKATSIVGKQLSAYCNGTRSRATFFCLRWVVITSSCDFLWRQNGEHRASPAFGVSAISFWPSEGRRVGSSKRSSRRAFEIAQSKTEVSRGSTKQCSNCKFTT